MESIYQRFGDSLKSILEYASIYIEQFELSVTPVKGKVPSIGKGWQNVHGDSVLAERYEDHWLRATGLGMLCGAPSGIICLDIDIMEGDHQLKDIRTELNKKLPPLMLGRIGNSKKPPARFYKYNGEKNKKWIYINIELLSTGNQVLLPPSLHPETGDLYKWAGKKISQVDLDHLPDLPEWIYDYLGEKNDEEKKRRKKFRKVSDKQGSSKGYVKTDIKSSVGRCKHQSHNHISHFAVAKFKSGLAKDELIKAVISYDKVINLGADYYYFNCPSRKEWRDKNDTIKNATQFVNQIFGNDNLSGQHGIDRTRLSTGGSSSQSARPSKVSKQSKSPGEELDFRWEDDKGKKHPSHNYDDFCTLFEFMYPTARKDFFSKTCFYRIKAEEWTPIENELKLIRAESRICGLVVGHVEDNLYKWLASHKPRLLIDIPKWDGTDHIQKVLDYVTVKNVTHDEFVSLFKAWMAGIFKRVYHSEFHNQCVILKGDQGIGKDMLMGNIFKILNGYYSEISMSTRQKDNYESIESLMVSYLPEFDESSRIPISTIKAFISANKATFRGAYDRKASAHTFRHSVVSSANFDNILRDPTGNRRFWIFELGSIDWDYNKVLDSGQLMAQSFHLYKDKFKASVEAMQAMKSYIKEMTPMATEDLFIEDAHQIIKERIKNLGDAATGETLKSKKLEEVNKLRWHQISADVVATAKRYNLAPRSAQTILKQKGYSKADRNSTYYRLP